MAVFLTRMAFAPVFTGDDRPSGVWWWRIYLQYNRIVEDQDFHGADTGQRVVSISFIQLNVVKIDEYTLKHIALSLNNNFRK